MSDSEDSTVTYTEVSSPFKDLRGYIVDSDLEEDEEDLKEDPKEDPTDYPTDGGDDDESSDDDEDNDDDVEEDEEEEEHPTPADSIPPPVHRLRAETPSNSHPLPLSIPPSGTPPILPIPLPTPSPPMLLPSTVCRAGVSEVRLPPRKRLCIALGPKEYGGRGETPGEMLDTDEIYGRRDDAHDDRLLMSGRLIMLIEYKCAHARTTRLMETKARLSLMAWVQSMDASDTARSEVTALQTTVLAQQTKIAAF
ncbi:hypothetical protein Tco_0567899 [Tanacetum coccineum]